MPLPERLRAAAQQVPRAPAGDADSTYRRGRRRARRRYTRNGLVVVAVAVVAVVAVNLPLDSPAAPPVTDQPGQDGSSTSVLLVPPAGEVVAEFVAGHPVFVVHDEDGTVRVLDAVSTHTPWEQEKVLAWCRTSGWFEDLWHGSRFDLNGDWVGGPAPTGLAAYEITGRQEGRVAVGERRPPPPRRSEAANQPPRPAGPACDDRTALYLTDHRADPAVLDDLVVHDDPGDATGLWYPTPARILGDAPRDPP